MEELVAKIGVREARKKLILTGRARYQYPPDINSTANSHTLEGGSAGGSAGAAAQAASGAGIIDGLLALPHQGGVEQSRLSLALSLMEDHVATTIDPDRLTGNKIQSCFNKQTLRP